MLNKKWLPLFRKELKSQGKTAKREVNGVTKTHFQYMTDALQEVFNVQHEKAKAGMVKDILAIENVYEKAKKSLDLLGAPKVKKTIAVRKKKETSKDEDAEEEEIKVN